MLWLMLYRLTGCGHGFVPPAAQRGGRRSSELERQARTNYRWERPTTIPEHGIIQVDGHPSFR